MEQNLNTAFARMMGINGDPFIEEILTTGMLSESSYQAICNNIQYNSKDSICQYFGIVHYYYLVGLKKAKGALY